MEDNLTGLVMAAVVVAVILFSLVVVVSCYCWRKLERKRTKPVKPRRASMGTTSTYMGHSHYQHSPYYLPTPYQYPAIPGMHLGMYRPEYLEAYQFPDHVMSSEERVSPRSTDSRVTEAVYVTQANGDIPRDDDKWKQSRPKPRKYPDWVRKTYEETGKVLDIGDDEKSKQSSTYSKKVAPKTSNILDEYTIVDYVITKDAPTNSSIYTTTISQRKNTDTVTQSTSSNTRPSTPPPPPPPPPPSPPQLPISERTTVSTTHTHINMAAGYSSLQEVKLRSATQKAETTKQTETEDYWLSHRQRRPQEGAVLFSVPLYNDNVVPVTLHKETYSDNVVPGTSHKETYNGNVVPVTLHKETYNGNVVPVTSHKETYNGNVVPVTLHKETYSGNVVPVTSHKETYSGNVVPVTSHKETYSDNVVPVTLHKETYSDNVVPVTSHKETYSDNVVPVTSHKETYSDNVVPVTSHKETYSDNVVPVTSHKETYSDNTIPVTSYNETYYSASYEPDPVFDEGIPEDEIQEKYVARITNHGDQMTPRNSEHNGHQHHGHHHHHHQGDNEDDNDDHHIDYRVIRKSGRKPSWWESTGSWFKRGKKKPSSVSK